MLLNVMNAREKFLGMLTASKKKGEGLVSTVLVIVVIVGLVAIFKDGVAPYISLVVEKIGEGIMQMFA